ncbi:hypothetical protein EDD18DRAFT_1345456 [Armillaria luteobubalina]|uniref:Uncharacterized protein n=1 Tax=Armillaria luteobubalina TaxID=153913 RepID=A0AA39QGS1_9AGAR|nr:hypothetical protein EDD18DRAFT_1345456 [Armillaria luteobubalina]
MLTIHLYLFACSHRNHAQPDPATLVPAAEPAGTAEPVAAADVHQVEQPPSSPPQVLQPTIPLQAPPTPGIQPTFRVHGYNHYRPPNTQGVFPTPLEMQTLAVRPEQALRPALSPTRHLAEPAPAHPIRHARFEEDLVSSDDELLIHQRILR